MNLKIVIAALFIGCALSFLACEETSNENFETISTLQLQNAIQISKQSTLPLQFDPE